MPGNTEELAIVVRLKNFATKELKGLSRDLKDLGSTAVSAFKAISFGGLAAGLAGGAGLFALLKSAADRADELNDLARQLGVSIEALGALQFAAKQSGVSVEELETGLKTLNKGLGELGQTGGGPAAEALNSLSSGLRQLVRDGAPTEEIFLAVVKELKNLSQADRALVSGQIFGKGGSRILRLVGEDVDGLMQRFRELGGVIDQDLAQKGDAFNDSLGELGTAARGLANDIARGLLPAATDLSNLLTDQLVKNKPAVLGFLADAVEGFGTFSAAVGETAISLEKSLGAISTAINVVSRSSLVAQRTLREAALFTGVPDPFGSIRGQIADINKEIDKLDKSAIGSGQVEAGIRSGIEAIGVATGTAAKKLRELAAEQTKANEELEFMGPLLKDAFEIYGPFNDRTAEAIANGEEFTKKTKQQKDALEELNEQLNEISAEQVERNLREIETARERAQELHEEIDLVAGLKAAVRDLSEEYQRWGLAARQAVHGVTDSIAGNATSAFLDYLEHVKSGKDAFKDFTRSVLRDIARIIIQTLILKAIQGAAGGIGGLFSGGGTNQIDLGGGLQPHNVGKGGIVDGHLVPVGHGLQGGGVVQREGLFRIRERGQNEAVVPLPDNRHIPVRLLNAPRGGGVVLNVNLAYTSLARSDTEEARMLEQNAKTITSIVASQLIQDPNFREAMRPAA